MRLFRMLFAAVAAVLICSAGAAAAPAAAAPGAAGAAVVRELAPGVYAFVGKDGATNSGFVVTDEGVVVIDTQGPRELALELKERIREVTARPVIYVINTHYHGDHTFGNQYFREARAIIAHEETRRTLKESDRAHRTRFKKFFGEESLVGFNPTLPDLTFTERLTLRVGGRVFVLIHTPVAHTRGDVYVHMPAEGVVFAGDVLYKGRLPYLGEGDTAGAVAALDGLLATGAGVFLPGHGEVAGREDVLAYRGYLTKLVAEVERLAAEGKTMEQVTEEIELPEYSGYLMYDRWLGQNAGAVYREITGK